MDANRTIPYHGSASHAERGLPLHERASNWHDAYDPEPDTRPTCRKCGDVLIAEQDRDDLCSPCEFDLFTAHCPRLSPLRRQWARAFQPGGIFAPIGGAR